MLRIVILRVLTSYLKVTTVVTWGCERPFFGRVWDGVSCSYLRGECLRKEMQNRAVSREPLFVAHETKEVVKLYNSKPFERLYLSRKIWWGCGCSETVQAGCGLPHKKDVTTYIHTAWQWWLGSFEWQTVNGHDVRCVILLATINNITFHR